MFSSLIMYTYEQTHLGTSYVVIVITIIIDSIVHYNNVHAFLLLYPLGGVSYKDYEYNTQRAGRNVTS